MESLQKSISITLKYNQQVVEVQTCPGDYQSLMTLIANELAIPGFGLCCGMGSCGTCRVMLNYQQHLNKTDLLSCGIAVDSALDCTMVYIPNDFY